MENTVNKDRSRLRSSLRRIAAAGLFGLCSLSAAFAQKQDYVQYVNTLQGTDSKFELSYGNTYATTGMPYGMHTWGAQTGPNGEGWKYQYSVDKIRGFQQAHQCSPWMSDYAVYSLMPEVGELVVNEDARASKFSHANEIAKPHYYRVTLDNGITTEMAPTTRGVHLRFTYPRKGDAYLVLDGYFAMSGMKIDPAKRQISGWVNNQRFVNHPETFRNYFVIQFDRPFEEYGLWENEHDERFPGMTEGEGKGYGAYVRFKAGTKVQARAASSYISPEQALLTLDRELGADKNLEATRKRGAETWNALLGRIAVEGGTDEEIRTFYSCLFRANLFSRKFYERDAEGNPYYYSPYDGKVHAGYMYTDNGFWDTFRSQFPLTNILHPTMQGRYMNALLAAQEQCGWLPSWSAPGETGGMIGNHAISLLTDAWAKGIRTFDPQKALEAYAKEAMNKGPWGGANGRAGWKEYWQLGYVSYPESMGSTAQTLEYAYDDFCGYQLARMTGNKFYEEIFSRVMYNYRNVFDKESGFMRGRLKDGSWLAPFDPYEWGGPYCEGNAWHYNWSVFHDVQGLINLYGSDEAFTAKIDSVFTVPNVIRPGTYGGMIHEMKEMELAGMGQYAHGNQPIQHMIYLYSYAGQPWKTQYWSRQITGRLYNSSERGYPGDEDQGGMSSWYILSSLGIYSVCPGTDQYVLGSPVFRKATITMEDGRKFVIEADGLYPVRDAQRQAARQELHHLQGHRRRRRHAPGNGPRAQQGARHGQGCGSLLAFQTRMNRSTTEIPKDMFKSLKTISLSLAALLLGAGSACGQQSDSYAHKVNTLIGTRGVGLTSGYLYPGATYPFGMVQFTPTYFAKRGGFVINQLSGGGCSHMGNFPTFPVTGKLDSSPENILDYRVGICGEQGHAGYYEATVQEAVKAQLTVTERTGMARYEYPAGEAFGTVIIGAGIAATPIEQAAVVITGPNSCEGYAEGGSFCGVRTPYKVYFVAEFDARAVTTGIWKEDRLTPGGRFAEGSESGVYFTFDLTENRNVQYKIGVSYVSVENARANLAAENAGWDFAAVQHAAERRWNDYLGLIEAEGTNPDRTTQFYTHLYRVLIHPNVCSDVNGEYMGADFRVHRSRSKQYTSFSNWDTYRTQIQLLSMLAPDVASDVVLSHQHFAEQSGGAFPRWVMANIETGIMQGDPTPILIANAWAFGAQDYDPFPLFQIMRRNAEVPGAKSQDVEERPGLKQYLEKGYYNASEQLEYTSSDFAIGQFALHACGDEFASWRYFHYARSWKNLYNPQTGWLQSRNADGSWKPLGEDWRESTYKNYFWMVPYDLAGLIETMGGKAAAEKRLDEFFVRLDAGYNDPWFASGNEPSFHIPWVYNWLGRPDKTSKVINRILNEQYTSAPDGLPGNDDLGTMGAWYVFACTGLYPMIPGVGGFTLSTPVFDKVVIHLKHGDITITGGSEKQIYTTALKLDGKPYGSTWIGWDALRNGATLEYTTSAKPSGNWGRTQLPPSYE